MKAANFLFVIAVIAVGVAFLNLAVTLNKVSDMTGYASTGEANLTIESSVSINFTTTSIDWDSGRVNDNEQNATLDTKSNNVLRGNWTATANGLALENYGNANVSLNLTAGSTAASFIGGDEPAYKWLLENNGTGACTAVDVALDAEAASNSVSPGDHICYPLNYEVGKNSIFIHINLTVPYNSKKGTLSDTITASATAMP